MPKLTDEQLLIKEPYKSIIYLFFKKDNLLEGLKAEDFLKEIKIKNSVALDKCLKVLIKRNWIKTKGKPKYYKYFLTMFFFAEDIKRYINDNLNLYGEHNILVDFVFNKIMQKDFNKLKTSSWVLFGLPPEAIEYLTQKDKIILNNSINKIVENLNKILEMKLKLIKKEVKGKKIIEEELSAKEFFNISNISFYYRCTSLKYLKKFKIL